MLSTRSLRSQISRKNTGRRSNSKPNSRCFHTLSFRSTHSLIIQSSHEKTLVHALEPDWIAKAENQARDFLYEIRSLRLRHGQGSSWIYGDEFGPTALDAHTVVFIARLFDANRADLMTEDIQEYGQSIMPQPAWKSVMDGRPTLHSLWVKEQKS